MIKVTRNDHNYPQTYEKNMQVAHAHCSSGWYLASRARTLMQLEALMHRTITIAKANFTTREFSQKSSTFLYLPSVLQLHK